MKCKNCAYYWQDDDDDFPQCHFNKIADLDLAPCEQPDDYRNEVLETIEE